VCKVCVRCGSRCGFLGAGDQPDTEARVCCFVPAMAVPIADVSTATAHSRGAGVYVGAPWAFLSRVRSVYLGPRRPVNLHESRAGLAESVGSSLRGVCVEEKNMYSSRY
jgi:hypothetical protein